MSASFIYHFATLEDPRVERNQRHYFMDIILLTICAVVSGAEGWEAIEEFGLEHKRVQQEAPQESLTLTLAKVGKTPYGELIFTFENGQVWRQVSKEAFTASIGESYQLQRGAFNSFFINKEGQFKKTRVRRDK